MCIKLLRIDPGQWRVTVQLGRIAHRRGDNETAVKILETMLLKHPDCKSAHRMLGQVYDDMGKIKAAERHRKKAKGKESEGRLSNQNASNLRRQ